MGRGSGEQLLVLLGSKYSFPCIILPVEFHHRDMVNQPFLSRQFEQVLETGQLTVNASFRTGSRSVRRALSAYLFVLFHVPAGDLWEQEGTEEVLQVPATQGIPFPGAFFCRVLIQVDVCPPGKGHA